MNSLLTLLFLPQGGIAIVFAVFNTILFLGAMVFAIVSHIRDMQHRAQLERALALRNIPTTRSSEEFHQEASSIVGADSPLYDVLQTLQRMSALKAKPDNMIMTIDPFHSSSLMGSLMLRLLPLLGFAGSLLLLLDMLGTPVLPQIHIGQAISTALQPTVWALLATLMLVVYGALRERGAHANLRMFRELLATDLCARYFRDDFRERTQHLLTWGDQAFRQLAAVADQLDTAVNLLHKTVDTISDVAANVQVDQERLNAIVTAFDKGTERLIAYKDDVTEILQRFFAIDAKIYENHVRFNERTTELYEHLEKQNRLLVDVREEIAKHELTRVGIIEEFLSREDLILREVKEYARAFAGFAENQAHRAANGTASDAGAAS